MLIVEDDPAMSEVIAVALASRDYSVTTARTGRQALDLMAEDEADVVILDLGLPDIDGIEVCRLLRRSYTNPVIVLSADGAEERKISALDEGADDYVTKPFSMPELLARLRVALRHRQLASLATDPAVLALGDLAIDIDAHVASLGGEPMGLTRKEFLLLALLARNPGRVLTHGTILTQVWGSTRAGTTESLRVHITQLRKKLGHGPERPQLLTEPGVGYRLTLSAEPAHETLP